MLFSLFERSINIASIMNNIIEKTDLITCICEVRTNIINEILSLCSSRVKRINVTTTTNIFTKSKQTVGVIYFVCYLMFLKKLSDMKVFKRVTET